MKKKLLTTVIVCSAAIICLANLAPTTVTIDGVTVTDRAKVINGETWIPVSDLAKAKGMTINRTDSSIDLSTAGGANQVSGMTGKVGQMINTGKWRFQVNSFQKADSYKVKNKTSTDYSITSGVSEYDDDTFTPKPGYQLYVAACTLKNARTEAVQFDWNPIDNHSSVADSGGSNHPWLVYDIASPAFMSSDILPGSKIDFNICFAVKDDATPSELVLMLKSLSDKKPDVVRISVGN